MVSFSPVWNNVPYSGRHNVQYRRWNSLYRSRNYVHIEGELMYSTEEEQYAIQVDNVQHRRGK
jgi:hypothetical protein